MSLSPEWTTDLGVPDDDLSFVGAHEEAGIVVLGVDESTGTAASILSTATGREISRFETTGEVQGSSYWPSVDLLFVTTDADYVYAVDPGSGTVRWDAQASTVGAVSGGTVYLYGGSVVWAYEPDGSEVWRATLPDEVRKVDGTRDDARYVVVGDYGDRTLVSLDDSDGSERWGWDRLDQIRITESGIFAISNWFNNNRVISLDPGSGSKSWQFEGEELILPDSPIYQHTLVIGAPDDGVVYGLDLQSGEQQWTSESYKSVQSIPDSASLYTLFKREVYNDYQNEYSLHRIDPDTGRSIWRQSIGDSVTRLKKTEDGVYVDTSTLMTKGKIYRINDATGTAVWESDIKWGGDRSFDLTIDPIVVPDKPVHALDRKDGAEQWNFSADWSSAARITTGSTYTFLMTSSDNISSAYFLQTVDGTVERTVQDPVGFYHGSNVVFVIHGGVEAYALSDDPALLTDRGSGTGTKVHESNRTDPTEVYDPTGADQSTPDVAFCPYCGADLDDQIDAKFCPECGENLPS